MAAISLNRTTILVHALISSIHLLGTVYREQFTSNWAWWVTQIVTPLGQGGKKSSNNHHLLLYMGRVLF